MPLKFDLINQTSFLFEIVHIHEAKKIHNHFSNLATNIQKKLFVPLDRLNKAIRRTDIVDKAIELGIAMDAVFLEKEKELTYKLKLRAALLLGKNFLERKKIMGLFKILYDLRSKAVHDGHIPKKK